VLNEALATVDKSEERWWEAELYRLKGQLLLSAERMANGKEARPKQNDERNPTK
jgi:hypothetical protein